MTQLLTNPIWSSLTSVHAHFAERSGNVLRYPADVGPFPAVAHHGEPCSDALSHLVAVDESVVFVGHLPTLDASWHVEQHADLLQMACAKLAPRAEARVGFRELNMQDSDAMVALTLLVFPGYFRSRTPEMGRYIGVFAGGELVAMAGERMAMTGLCEISAVCTDPRYNGRGYAAMLVRVLCEDLFARGVTPFLHVSPGNTRARQLYESLGFIDHATHKMLRVKRVR
jgi:ribosomal protein S18 acetylase RimI-like enzyme